MDCLSEVEEYEISIAVVQHKIGNCNRLKE